MHLENEMDNQGSITIQIKMDEYRGLETALAARISEVAKELDKHNGQAETLQKELNVANDLVENFRNMRQEYENEYEKFKATENGELKNESKTRFELKKEEAEEIDAQISDRLRGSRCPTC